MREARGERVVGFKIGFTSPTVRTNAATLMGLDESVHGYLWEREAYLNGAEVAHARLGIEGELAVSLIECAGDNVSNWVVDYQPIIELHMLGYRPEQMWDGPPADNHGRRGLELIGTNCVHTGVVHCDTQRRGRIAEIPLDEIMRVHIGGKLIEEVTLTELAVDGVYGPAGTIGWLLRTLRREANGEDALLRPGTQLLCSTPGGLYPVPSGQGVEVAFAGMTTRCTAD
ncbi:MAG: hypothetical protein AAF513_00700 [Pseudomonadota bacterium]